MMNYEHFQAETCSDLDLFDEFFAFCGCDQLTFSCSFFCRCQIPSRDEICFYIMKIIKTPRRFKKKKHYYKVVSFFACLWVKCINRHGNLYKDGTALGIRQCKKQTRPIISKRRQFKGHFRHNKLWKHVYAQNLIFLLAIRQVNLWYL